MKAICTTILLIFLCFLVLESKCQPGSSCANAYPLTVGGSAEIIDLAPMPQGTSVLFLRGQGKVVYLQYTQVAGQKVKFYILTAPGIAWEAVVYNSNCVLQTAQQHRILCMSGEGYWSPAGGATLAAGVWKLRIRVLSGYTGNINVKAVADNSTNDNCAGAELVTSSILVTDNATGSAGTVNASSLCANTNDNDKFYRIVIPNNGTSYLYVSAITCAQSNNGQGGFFNNGIQMGIFSGDCNNAVWQSCQELTYSPTGWESDPEAALPSAYGSNNTVFTLSGYAPGTVLTFVVDGRSGSRCKYNLSYSELFPLFITPGTRIINVRPVMKGRGIVWDGSSFFYRPWRNGEYEIAIVNAVGQYVYQSKQYFAADRLTRLTMPALKNGNYILLCGDDKKQFNQ